MVTVENPKHYGAKMRNEILAGPAAIKYRSYSKYFFEVGIKLATIPGREEDVDLRMVLRSAYCGSRYISLMARSLSK
jgi:hypothetical protein